MSDVNLVKEFGRSVGRLRRGEISAVRVVGLGRAALERHMLVESLVEDLPLTRDLDVRRLPEDRGFEIAAVPSTADGVIEIDIGSVAR